MVDMSNFSARVTKSCKSIQIRFYLWFVMVLFGWMQDMLTFEANANVLECKITMNLFTHPDMDNKIPMLRIQWKKPQTKSMQNDLFIASAEVLHIVLHSGFARSFWLRLLPDNFLSEKGPNAKPVPHHSGHPKTTKIHIQNEHISTIKPVNTDDFCPPPGSATPLP